MSNLRTCRVLVIDDEERVRTLFADFVAALGYEPDPVGDAAEGLARAEAGGYDLVLTDLVMPGRLNGLDVAETLRKRVPDLPVIIISAVAGTAEADAIRRRGFVFLEKPIKLPVFRAELERVLGPPAAPQEVPQAS
jgi:DNA-binding NtrC family response regulator